MSHEATGWALGSTVGDSTRKLVLYGLANHAHKNGRHAYPGKRTLAEYAECDVKTVKRKLKQLREAGFIRLGDQSMVAHIRADRRPTVYDLAMSETTRLDWKASHERGDILPPGSDDLEDLDAEPRGDSESPRPGGGLSPRANSHGGTGEASRGDTALSPEPLGTTTPVAPKACPAHGERPHASCRDCGTAARSVAAAEAREQRRRARVTQDAQVQAERRQRASAPSTSTPHGRQLVADVRAQIRPSR